MVKNTTVARVLPASAAITASPSRSRVVARSFTSFWRLIQPSRDSEDDAVLVDDEVLGRVLDLGLGGGERRAPRVLADRRIGGAHRLDLAARTIAQRFVSSSSERAQLAAALARRRQLLLDHLDLEPRQPVDLQLEDGVGLLGVEAEAGHDLPRRVGLALGLADDLQDLVEGVEDLGEAFEQVLPPRQRRQLVLEPLA